MFQCLPGNSRPATSGALPSLISVCDVFQGSPTVMKWRLSLNSVKADRETVPTRLQLATTKGSSTSANWSTRVQHTFSPHPSDQAETRRQSTVQSPGQARLKRRLPPREAQAVECQSENSSATSRPWTVTAWNVGVNLYSQQSWFPATSFKLLCPQNDWNWTGVTYFRLALTSLLFYLIIRLWTADNNWGLGSVDSKEMTLEENQQWLSVKDTGIWHSEYGIIMRKKTTKNKNWGFWCCSTNINLAEQQLNLDKSQKQNSNNQKTESLYKCVQLLTGRRVNVTQSILQKAKTQKNNISKERRKQ